MESSSTSPVDANGRASASFIWRDRGHFVELHPVETGWLLLWGRHRDGGGDRVLAGNRTYLALCDARRRLADAVLEMTHRPAVAASVLDRLDQTSLPSHRAQPLPEPL